MIFDRFNQSDFIYFIEHLLCDKIESHLPVPFTDQIDDYCYLQKKYPNWDMDRFYDSNGIVLGLSLDGYSFYAYCCARYQFLLKKNREHELICAYTKHKIIQQDKSFLLFEVKDLRSEERRVGKECSS